MYLQDVDEERKGVSVDDFISDRILFREINSKKPKDNDHNGGANKIHRNKLKLPISFSCNCGEIHPIVGKEKFFPRWGIVLSNSTNKELKEGDISYARFWAISTTSM